MKTARIILTSALAAMCLTGCGKWLDVSPVDEISKENMYKTPEGFYNVLNGIYQDLGSQELYGKNLTWGAMEAWAKEYSLNQEVGAHESLLSFQNLEYGDRGAVSFGKTVWIGAYKDIARANEFMQSCSEKPEDFFHYGETEKKVLMGEALAIRAMLHFDILRIFAQSPAVEGENDKAYVPYVETYPSKVNPPVKTSEVLSKIAADLAEAAELVGAYDTLEVNRSFVLGASSRFSESVKPEWGRFYSLRGTHLNYYAIRLLQARVALYAGDYGHAAEYAGEIKKLVDDKATSLATSGSISASPKIMTEALFAFYDNKLIEHTRDWFDRTNTQVLRVEDPGIFTAIKTDKRSSIVSNGVFTIFNEDKNGSDTEYIPAIRMSEAYFILAEALANTDRLTEAITVFNVLMKQRGITSASYQMPKDADLEAFYKYLITDARKEFPCMGQNIFMYKRLNIPVQYSNGDSPETKGRLVIPIPDTESAI